MPFIVYMLQCSDQSLYIGSTTDLPKRLHQHNNLKSGAHYTKIRRPVTLVYHEIHETYAEARAREAHLKTLPRAQKLLLTTLCARDLKNRDRAPLEEWSGRSS